MFDKKGKRFFVVISRLGGVSDGTHYATIEGARERAEVMARNNPEHEFLVCCVDSSYTAVGMTATHYS